MNNQRGNSARLNYRSGFPGDGNTESDENEISDFDRKSIGRFRSTIKDSRVQMTETRAVEKNLKEKMSEMRPKEGAEKKKSLI